MSEEELGAFLAEELIVSCASIGRDGWPHVMPLWYIVRDGSLWAWTYATSQKARNLGRDPRATLLVEAGEDYDELRGAMFKTRAEIERDPELVTALGLAIYERYYDEVPHDVREGVLRQAPKRVGIRFVEESRATWDHRKLAAAT
jgi:nitroimidazol reductase NimA-like FMN-containing flavoprotein (pyridoxamine 5'-phosphate oxidase superfamily)